MNMKTLILLAITVSLVACSGFKAKRVDNEESDERGLKITDEWVTKDTENAIAETLKQMKNHKGYRRFMGRYQGTPKVFIAEVQNNTSEAFFPIDDMNDEFLYKISSEGDFVLVDEKARDRVLKEITYQNDGMVDPATAKKVGKQTGADLMIFGSVHMRPHTRKGKTIKEYTVNLRMTDIERGTEVLRTRTRVNKYSTNSALGW